MGVTQSTDWPLIIAILGGSTLSGSERPSLTSLPLPAPPSALTSLTC